MMFTDLTYTQIGAAISALLIFVLLFVILYRLVISFRHYVYHGDIGDGEKSAFVSLMEGKWSDLVKYAFSGYHPGMIVVDTFFIGLFCLVMAGLWAPIIFISLFLLLAHTMRKRIEVKQTFVSNLKGEQADENENN